VSYDNDSDNEAQGPGGNESPATGEEGSPGKGPTVYVISDAIGETAELVAKAAASQFAGNGIRIKRFSYVDDRETIRKVLEAIEPGDKGTIVAYTLIYPDLRDFIAEICNSRNIPCVDIMGPIMAALSKVTNHEPSLHPGLVHRLDEDYFRRIAAIEFAVRYDDGKDPRGMLDADVVVVGVSRTSKTPVCMYLAHRQVKAANMPLVPEVEPPRELFKIDAQKIVGFNIQPRLLEEIRQERLKAIGLKSDSSYASINRIYEELEYSRGIMRRLGCTVVDVTNKAIEETANLVYELARSRGLIR